MKITFLIDNMTESELHSEWGLSVHIEYEEHRILLDFGASELFAQNAEKLGIDLNQVDVAVLSHAHFDHADGLEYFCGINDHAPVYIRKGSAENCYEKTESTCRYIGIKPGTLEAFHNRLIEVDGQQEILSGVYILPHRHPDGEIGLKNHMAVCLDGEWKPDDFDHEQSLIFKTEKGLVVFNSCSHLGVDRIIDEVADAFPNDRIAAYIGGFHLFKASDEMVTALADQLKTAGVERMVTGHCTGERAFELLKEHLGDGVAAFYSGMRLEF